MLEVRVFSRYGKRIIMNAKEVYFNGANGRTGILDNHALYLGVVNYGQIVLKDESDRFVKILVDAGYVSVENNKVSFFLTNAEELNKDNLEELESQVAFLEEQKEQFGEEEKKRLSFLKRAVESTTVNN